MHNSKEPNTLHKDKPPFFHANAKAVPSGVHFMQVTEPATAPASKSQKFIKSFIIRKHLKFALILTETR